MWATDPLRISTGQVAATVNVKAKVKGRFTFTSLPVTAALRDSELKVEHRPVLTKTIDLARSADHQNDLHILYQKLE